MDERSTYTILVVDDSAAMLYATARSLRAAGFQTLEASSGARALELAEYASLVILDVNLPDIHGLEVARLLRAHPRTAFLPIVHVSATRTRPADAAAALSAGGDEFLVAPVAPADLVSAAERLIERSVERFPTPEQRHWVQLHRQLIAAEHELLTLAKRVASHEVGAAQLDAAEELVRTLRQEAQSALGQAVTRLRSSA